MSLISALRVELGVVERELRAVGAVGTVQARWPAHGPIPVRPARAAGPVSSSSSRAAVRRIPS
eukprot:898632-Heterocapsa_arctica.AAC.1